MGVYASEFGCVAMSSFESMSVYLAPDHWTLHTSVMSQRNYPCDNILQQCYNELLLLLWYIYTAFYKIWW